MQRAHSKMDNQHLSILATFDDMRRWESVLNDGAAEVGKLVTGKNSGMQQPNLNQQQQLLQTLLPSHLRFVVYFSRISTLRPVAGRKTHPVVDGRAGSPTRPARTGLVAAECGRIGDETVSCPTAARVGTTRQMRIGQGSRSAGEFDWVLLREHCLFGWPIIYDD